VPTCPRPIPQNKTAGLAQQPASGLLKKRYTHLSSPNGNIALEDILPSVSHVSSLLKVFLDMMCYSRLISLKASTNRTSRRRRSKIYRHHPSIHIYSSIPTTPLTTPTAQIREIISKTAPPTHPLPTILTPYALVPHIRIPRTPPPSTNLPIPAHSGPRPPDRLLRRQRLRLPTQALHAPDAPISQPHLDAAWMVAAREQLADDAAHLAARWLVCF
jgi:hypothetical protein